MHSFVIHVSSRASDAVDNVIGKIATQPTADFVIYKSHLYFQLNLNDTHNQHKCAITAPISIETVNLQVSNARLNTKPVYVVVDGVPRDMIFRPVGVEYVAQFTPVLRRDFNQAIFTDGFHRRHSSLM